MHATASITPATNWEPGLVGLQKKPAVLIIDEGSVLKKIPRGHSTRQTLKTHKRPQWKGSLQRYTYEQNKTHPDDPRTSRESGKVVNPLKKIHPIQERPKEC